MIRKSRLISTPREQASIIVDDLIKNFEVVEKKQGLLGGVSSLFFPKKTQVRALKGISFKINPGELVGFIGPNGAGKTTTLKVLSGLLYPTAGFIQVLGYDPWKRSPDFLKQISLVMGQKNQLWWDLPAIETFTLNKAIYEIPHAVYRDTLEELVKLLDVGKYLNVPVRKLSLGQRMRLELIAALLHRPKVLFLDEPTLGLDVTAQKIVKDFIYDYNRKFEATMILTTHNMNDLLDLAKRIIVVDKGEVIFDGDIQKLILDYAKEKTIHMYFAKEIDIKKLESMGKVKKFDYPQASLSVPREVSAVAASEILQNFPISDLTIEEESIEEIIRRLFKEGVRKTKKTVS